MKKLFNPNQVISYLIIIIIDILAFFLTVYILRRLYFNVSGIIEGMPHPYVLLSQSYEEIQEIFTPDPRIKILLSIIMAFSMVFIVFLITRTAVWIVMSEKSMNWKSFGKFLLITFCWYLILIPASILIYFMNSQYAVAFIITFLIVFMHYTISLNLHLAKKQEFSQVKHALAIGTKRIHYFLLIYVPFLIILSIALKLLWGHWYIFLALIALMFQISRHVLLNRLKKPLNI